VNALRHLAQQLVAGGVAERVVDLLEPVEVEEEQRDVLVQPVRGAERAPQAVLEALPIGQAGEAVVVGQVANPLLGLLAL
jgi:hypothetical protein